MDYWDPYLGLDQDKHSFLPKLLGKYIFKFLSYKYLFNFFIRILILGMRICMLPAF